MIRYLKDPIIAFSAVAWIIAFLVLCAKMMNPVSVTATGSTSQAGVNTASAFPPSAVPATPYFPGNHAVLTNTNPPPQAVTAPGSAVLPAVAGAPPVTGAITLNSLVRHTPGQLSVGTGAIYDTNDLDAAMKQITPDEKMIIGPGTYSLSEYPYSQVPEKRVVLGAGQSTVIRLHSKSISVKGNTRFENLVLEGPVGTATFWVSGSGILTLKNVTIRDSSFGVSAEQNGKLYAENLAVEKVDSFCVGLSNNSKALITDSNLSDCFTAVNAENFSKAEVHGTRFHYNTFAISVSDDRNHAECTSCSFEKVQNKANIESRVAITEKLNPSDAQATKSEPAEKNN